MDRLCSVFGCAHPHVVSGGASRQGGFSRSFGAPICLSLRVVKDATPLPLLGAKQQGPAKVVGRVDQSASFSASRTSGGGTTTPNQVPLGAWFGWGEG